MTPVGEESRVPDTQHTGRKPPLIDGCFQRFAAIEVRDVPVSIEYQELVFPLQKWPSRGINKRKTAFGEESRVFGTQLT